MRAPARVAHSAGSLFDRMDTGRLGLSRRPGFGRVVVGNVAGFDLRKGATRGRWAHVCRVRWRRAAGPADEAR